MTELISHKHGLGELSMLFPALADMGEQGRWIILVDPPWIPYPASLQGHGLLLKRLLLVHTHSEKESLWACEQALRSGRGGAVLAWPKQISFARLRRLQLAAESSSKLAFLFRPESALQQPSPAALRLQLEPADPCRIQVNVIKCRGGRASEPVWISQPFSAYAKQPHHTGDHAPLTEHNSNTMLAGYPLPAPGSRSLHPGPKRQESADRRQRSH
jgi:cell division inhibitor SulA/protein ImuA